jgi:hypothetical protein
LRQLRIYELQKSRSERFFDPTCQRKKESGFGTSSEKLDVDANNGIALSSLLFDVEVDTDFALKLYRSHPGSSTGTTFLRSSIALW